jgi:hypothetical protein
MTGFEPATTGATVRLEPRQEVAPRHDMPSETDLCDSEEGWSDPSDNLGGLIGSALRVTTLRHSLQRRS